MFPLTTYVVTKMKLININAVLFDLDGTLFDTAPDLARAINHTLAHYNLPPIASEILKPAISVGATQLIKQAFGFGPEHPEFKRIEQVCLSYYFEILPSDTQLYEGINDLLNHLDQQKTPWGIVTNRRYESARLLLDHFDLMKRCQCLIGGDTLAKKKPDPDPLLHACQLLNVSPKNTCYVGDAASDEVAANAAEMPFVWAKYGYHDALQPITSPYQIQSSMDLIHLL